MFARVSLQILYNQISLHGFCEEKALMYARKTEYNEPILCVLLLPGHVQFVDVIVTVFFSCMTHAKVFASSRSSSSSTLFEVSSPYRCHVCSILFLFLLTATFVCILILNDLK